jgi:hypothetical protein
MMMMIFTLLSLSLHISRVCPFLLSERTQNTQDQKEMKALPHTLGETAITIAKEEKKTRKHAFASLSDFEEEEEEEEKG